MNFNVIVSSEPAFSEVALAVLTAMLLENSEVQAQFTLQAPGERWSSSLGFGLQTGSRVTEEAFEHAITRANFAIFRAPQALPEATVRTWQHDCANQDPRVPLVRSKFDEVITALRDHFSSAQFAPLLAEARLA